MVEISVGILVGSIIMLGIVIIMLVNCARVEIKKAEAEKEE